MQKFIDGLLVLIFLLSVACVDCDSFIPSVVCVLSALGLYLTEKTYLIKEKEHIRKHGKDKRTSTG